MTQTARHPLDETERPERTLRFVHQREGRTASPLFQILLPIGRVTAFGARRRGCQDPARVVHDRRHRNAKYAYGVEPMDAVPPALERADINGPAVSNSHMRGFRQLPLAISAACRRTESLTPDSYHAGCVRALQVRRLRSLTTLPATSTTSRRGTLPRLSGYDGGKVEMLVGVLFHRSTRRAR